MGSLFVAGVLSPSQGAAKLDLAIKARENKDGKTITRFRISFNGIATLCNTSVITPNFTLEFIDACLQYNWCCFLVSSSSFGLIRLDAAANFRKMSGETLNEMLAADSSN